MTIRPTVTGFPFSVPAWSAAAEPVPPPPPPPLDPQPVIAAATQTAEKPAAIARLMGVRIGCTRFPFAGGAGVMNEHVMMIGRVLMNGRVVMN
jgi:hypothetical protein